MKLELLDTQTEEKKEIETGADLYDWAEGNWSCDCNRGLYFKKDPRMEPSCGHSRFLVTKILGNPERYSLRDLNDGYPEELLKKYSIT
jgi:hypothetical protein